MSFLLRGILALFLCAAGSMVMAQEAAPWQEYDQAIKASQEVSALSSGMFGENISGYDGSTYFRTVDIDLLGNNSLPVRLGRRHVVEDRFGRNYLGGFGNWEVEVPYIEGTFASAWGWTVANPTSPQRFSRCSIPSEPYINHTNFTSDEVWSGYHLYLPGRGEQNLLKWVPSTYKAPADGVVYPWTTRDLGRLSCLSAIQNGYAGEGFMLLTPDGVKYRFDWAVERSMRSLRKANGFEYVLPRKRVYLLATRIEDRFGNWVNYAYSGDKLTGITSSDGRAISLAYQGDKIVTATAAGKSWAYTYVGVDLYQVTQPDGSRWSYGSSGELRANYDDPDMLEVNDFKATCDSSTMGNGHYEYVVTHPSGAQGKFVFDLDRHYRVHVPFRCTLDIVRNSTGTSSTHVQEMTLTDPDIYNQAIKDGHSDSYATAISSYKTFVRVASAPTTLGSGETGHDRLLVPNYFENFSLTNSTVSGPGVSALVTQYEYGRVWPLGFCGRTPETPQCIGNRCVPASPDCPGLTSKWNTTTLPDGRKLRQRFGVAYEKNEGYLIETRELDAAGVTLRTTLNDYVPDDELATQAFSSKIGLSLTQERMGARIQPVTRTTISQDGVSYSNAVNAFDEFARPKTVTRSSNIGQGYARTDATTFHDNLSKWVLGQIASVSSGVTIPTSATYDPVTALPTDFYTFGIRKRTLTYNPDGTVATVKDANNNITTLSSWKRGIPQTIQHPATPESPSGSTQTAQVNDSGWIDWVADENGYKTNYGYDAMGRVSSIAYPVGDSVNWNTLTRAFVQVNQAEMGIPAGHWRQSTVQGNYEKQTFYDALWRPVVQYERDVTNNDQTYRITLSAYDHEGRQTFASYPRNPYADGNWAIDTGTWTQYDALGRVTKLEQDSELGKLTTTTAYSTGGDIVVTDPRGQQTRTRYAAWDQPTTDYPIEIIQPAGVTTVIDRDPAYFLRPKSVLRSGTYAGQPVQALRKYYYDGVNRLCRTDEPETGSTVMGYDNNDNLNWSAAGLSGLNTVDCDHVAAYNGGRTVTRNYDARNRLTQLGFPDGLGNQTWTYTPDGLPATITTYNGYNSTWPWVNAYHYNKRRLLDGQGDSISQPGWYAWSLGYGYDPNGHLSVQTYPTGLTVTYAPNGLGQPTQVATTPTSTTQGTYASGVSYYPNGAIKQFTYGNGVVHTMSQNARQLPDTVSDIGVAGYTYTYDKNGNTTQIVDNGQGANFNRYLSYDGLDRLTSAGSAMFGGSTHYINYAYDPIDNLRSVSHPGVREHTYWYDAKNRLTNVQNAGGATVTGLGYDVQGNLNNKNGQGYEFSYGNRLRAVTGKESYAYDGLGRRVQTMQADGTVRLFQYSQAGQYLFGYTQATAGAQTTHENVYLGGSLIATIDHNWPSNTVIATKYHHTDALGSPVATTNTSGAVIERTNYEPYGSPINKTINGIGYTGHVMDGATGLTYMQQRYYDPTLGRFLSVDPVSAVERGDLRLLNRYSYAYNNPYKFVDPDGRLGQVAGPVIVGGLICLRISSCRRTLVRWGGAAIAAAAGAWAGSQGNVLPVAQQSAEADVETGGEGASADSDSTGSPTGKVDLPSGLVGDQGSPLAGPNSTGKRHTSGTLAPEHGGQGDYEKDLETLTGGVRPWAPGDKAPPGSMVGENGVFGRPVNSSGGKSIDIPANGDKPHETLHYD
ncbi:RHS repeat-associated core domain-containing protein [Lysobacter sp. Root916]|uniref:RHS repeat domain-containing protein n=1 Tax=Lysobacter sp. Root916 TaxID=1736606 RepID=UPI000A6BCDB6|nr:RHS repeat-associated core domain-containing protein [Lysobacter sp. Root916]